jgi:nicotinate phosphoribosyltransferase
VPIFRDGQLVYRVPEIRAVQEHGRKQLECAPPEILKLNDPRHYEVGLERALLELRSRLIRRAKEQPV